MHGMTDLSVGAWKTYRSLLHAQQENQQLRVQLSSAESQILQLSRSRRQKCGRLRAVLDFKSQLPFQSVVRRTSLSSYPTPHGAYLGVDDSCSLTDRGLRPSFPRRRCAIQRSRRRCNPRGLRHPPAYLFAALVRRIPGPPSVDLAFPNNQYSYTADGLLASSNDATYTYDASAQRVRKDASAGSTEYIYFNGMLLALHNPATGAWTDWSSAGGTVLAAVAGYTEHSRRRPGRTRSRP